MATVEGSDDVEVCRGADVPVLLSEEERDGLQPGLPTVTGRGERLGGMLAGLGLQQGAAGPAGSPPARRLSRTCMSSAWVTSWGQSKRQLARLKKLVAAGIRPRSRMRPSS
jgi:hypothetical protein